ncbi:AAA-like domain-containing protein [Leptolyngbya iicbica]|nr:AAA-like domain-containing protein [Leptolyngbya sp. LK]
MSPREKFTKRQRGVFLSAEGRRRLTAAINQAAVLMNQGDRFTAADISQQTGVSKSTISRLWSGKVGVDHKSVQLIFSTFDLELTLDDLQSPQSKGAVGAASTPTPLSGPLPYPTGPVPLDSPLYVVRSPLEERAYHEMTQPGCVIRIKAPSGFGKSSLVLRLLAQAEKLGYGIASIDLLQVEPSTLTNPSAFLRWFCHAIAVKLGRQLNVEDYWSDVLGNALSTTLFIREQILDASAVPFLLHIKEFDRLFDHAATAQTVLPVLRSWYEEARHDAGWQRLRQVVSYATESYLPLDINQSPFNVGLPIPLPEFTPAQVNDLVAWHGLELDAVAQQQLMTLVGGHPQLIRLALYHLRQQALTLTELRQQAAERTGIFHSYLQEMLVRVQDGPEQMAVLKELVMSDRPISLDPILAYQLEATGLIKSTSTGWIMSLELYRDYLRNALFSLYE